MNRREIAERLISIAEELEEGQVGEEVNQIEAQDEAKEKLEEMAKTIQPLIAKFRDMNKDILDEYARLKKLLSNVTGELKERYKNFDKITGYSKLLDALMQQANLTMKVHDKLEMAGEAAVSLVKRESKQPSYKEQWEILWSTLNERERNKYQWLYDYCKKTMLEVSTGIDILDDTLKDWNDELKRIAQEREVTLPKASREASFWDDLVELAKKFVGKIKNLFLKLTGKVENANDMLEDAIAKLKKVELI